MRDHFIQKVTYNRYHVPTHHTVCGIQLTGTADSFETNEVCGNCARILRAKRKRWKTVKKQLAETFGIPETRF